MNLANFINGTFVPPRSGIYFDDVNPATEEVIAQIPDSDERDIDDAVAAAKAAFPAWSRTPAAERSRLLLKLADLIERDAEELARTESIDNGKTLSLARRRDVLHRWHHDRRSRRRQRGTAVQEVIAGAGGQESEPGLR